MVGDENAKKAIAELDDSEFMGTHIQVQVFYLAVLSVYKILQLKIAVIMFIIA